MLPGRSPLSLGGLLDVVLGDPALQRALETPTAPSLDLTGPPGLRPHYHQTYYGAFVLDPDGNNIEAVCHRPT